MQLLHPYLILKGVDVIKKEKIDLVIAEGIWAGLHAMIFRALTKVPYCLTEHNAEYIRWKRMGKKYSIILGVFEKYCCKFAEQVYCVSDDDRQLIHELGIDKNKIITVPNGVDTSKFKPNTKKEYEIKKELNLEIDTPIILFSGSLKYEPNFQAVQVIHDILIEKILNIYPDAKFVIVGSNPPLQFEHEAIIFTGTVEKIEDYLNAANIIIAPLISGGGTKLKIVEAIACGKNVVTTRIGAEGLIEKQTKEFLIVCDDWDDFANEIINKLKSHENDKLTKEFIERYSWDCIGGKLFNEISKIAIIKLKS
jgi:glycosyltransferase involved in cell wall biosynthesis